MLQIGSLVDHKYKILSEVGRGGMSVVYLAINERAHKTWAVKEVRKDGVCDFEAVKQGLVVETDMLKRLSHPHLPSIVDVIDTEDSFLIVMDYIEGKSLQSVLKSGGAQPEERVIEWGKQICDVLGYLHSREPAIIYRDMKPANVMLKPDGNITLIDFGTAREFKNRAMVEDTTCLGTRGYAAPEQFGGQGQSDARTDIYCVGATLYHLLTGHSPAEPPYEIKPLRYWNPQYAGTGIEKVIIKCCQQDPDARYQSCAELMYALEHVKDEDDAARRTRKLKWTGFVACLAVCLLGVAGMIFTSAKKSGAEKQTYSYFVEQAKENLTDERTAYENLRKAMQINPGREEAYSELVNGMIMQDSVLSDEETGYLTQCLNDRTDGDDNQTVLKKSNPAAYDRLMNDVGLLYFFQYDQANGIESAGTYFERVRDSEYLEPKQRELANILYKIANGYSKIDVQNYLESEYTNQDLYQDLVQILDGNLLEKVPSKKHGMAVCQKIANIVYQKCAGFKGDGVSEEQLNKLLDAAASALSTIQFDQQGQSWQDSLEKARNEIENARVEVQTTYNAPGVSDE